MARTMKDSGIEWVGEIPSEWKLLRGKNIFKQSSNRGNNESLVLLSPTQKYGVIPQELYESLSGLNAVKLNENTDLNNLKTVHVGAFVISLRSFQGGFEYSKYEGVVSPAYQVFYPIINIADGYYKYLFKDQTFIDKMNSYTLSLRDGKNISFADFGRTYIPYPPLSEQQQIADFLDEKVSKIDEILEKTKQSIEEYKKLKQAVITQAVTKGLDPNVEMKDSGIDWIGEIPKKWAVKRLKRLFHFGKGLPITKDNLLEDGVKVISYGQIHAKWNTGVTVDDRLYRFVSKEYPVNYPQAIVKYGDFIFADTSEDLDGCGNNVYIDKTDLICAGYHSITLKSIDDRSNKYLAYLFKIDSWRSQIRSGSEGVKLYSISQKALKSTTVLLPPIIEQERIVDFLDYKCSIIDNLIKNKEKLIKELESYKKSLIYEYVTGKKEVNPIANK